MIQIPQTIFDQIREHGQAAYPLESCGILIGTAAGSVSTVRLALPAQNASPHPRSHYEIAPLELIRAERAARKQALEILGFYHSHPDHPAHWSSTDLAEAHWLGSSYLITRIAAGRVGETHSFRLGGACEEEKHFKPEEVRLFETP